MITSEESKLACLESLVAVLFVTQSRPGPRLDFWYPTVPSVHNTQDSWQGRGNEQPRVDDVSVSQDEPRSNKPAQINKSSASEVDDAQGVVLGFSKDSLQKLLSAGRWCDRERFEVCVNGLTFLGRPVHAAQDGSWKGRHSHDDHDKVPESAAVTPEFVSPAGEEPDRTGQGAVDVPKRPRPQDQDFTHASQSLKTPNLCSLATSFNSNASTAASEAVQMFHVVFVLRAPINPTQLEELYENVVKKLSKALHYCQKQTAFITTESRKLLMLKTKAKHEGLSSETLCQQALETSELAWSLKELYDKISINSIATLSLNNTRMSLQIPPSPANQEWDEHAALLLLQPKHILLRDLPATSPSLLHQFIQVLTPTKPLRKHALTLNLPIDTILLLAAHLIEWRKALPIPPLHQNKSYTLHHLAPFHNLGNSTTDFAETFPGVPPLPRLLEVLSGKIIPWGAVIPSRDHREVYMQVLGWLVAGGWVEEWRSFAEVGGMMLKSGGDGVWEGLREGRSAADLLPAPSPPKEEEDAVG